MGLDYVTVDSVTYTNQPDLVDWDSVIDEWNPVFMEQLPFGNPLPELDPLQREVLDCLDRLDFDLDFEEWVMDQEEAALDDADNDFDDDDDKAMQGEFLPHEVIFPFLYPDCC